MTRSAVLLWVGYSSHWLVGSLRLPPSHANLPRSHGFVLTSVTPPCALFTLFCLHIFSCFVAVRTVILYSAFFFFTYSFSLLLFFSLYFPGYRSLLPPVFTFPSRTFSSHLPLHLPSARTLHPPTLITHDCPPGTPLPNHFQNRQCVSTQDTYRREAQSKEICSARFRASSKVFVIFVNTRAK